MDHGSALGMPSRGPLLSEPGRCDVNLSLPARAENTALVRHVIGALGESLLLRSELVEDLRLVVTEAFTNVVRHAYGGREGPVDIAVRPGGERLHITVTDRGRGMKPNPDSDGAGLGLPLIAALAEHFEILQPAEGGSVLRITIRHAPGRFQST